jgi:hypothetical protein
VTIAELVYLLCAAASIVAASLLIRYYRVQRVPLLFWSSIGFVGLGLHSVLVYADRAVLPDMNLSLARAITGALALLMLLYGLIDDAGAS